MDARDPLERVLYGDPPRNGAICNLHIIYYVLTTFATPKNHLFRSLLPSKTGQKQGSAPRSAKRPQK